VICAPVIEGYYIRRNTISFIFTTSRTVKNCLLWSTNGV